MRRISVVLLASLALGLAGCGDDGGSSGSGSASGPRTRAQDRAAQSDLRNAYVVAKVHFTDEETYKGLEPGEMEAIEPTLTYTDVEDAGPEVVGVGEQSDTRIMLVTQSKSGAWFCIAEDITQSPRYGEGDALDDIDTWSECANAEQWFETEAVLTYEEVEPEVEAESVADTNLGDEPEVEPLERMLDGVYRRDVDLFLSAFVAQSCDLATDSYESTLDPSALYPPYKADVESTGPDAAIVTVVDGEGVIDEVEVVLEDGIWVMDLDLCETTTSAGGSSAAQSDLRNAFAAAKTYWTDFDTYLGIDPAVLGEYVPGIATADLGAAGVGVVGVSVVSHAAVLLVTQSEEGPWYCLANDIYEGTTYGMGFAFEDVDTTAECASESWPTETTELTGDVEYYALCEDAETGAQYDLCVPPEGGW